MIKFKYGSLLWVQSTRQNEFELMNFIRLTNLKSIYFFIHQLETLLRDNWNGSFAFLLPCDIAPWMSKSLQLLYGDIEIRSIYHHTEFEPHPFINVQMRASSSHQNCKNLFLTLQQYQAVYQALLHNTHKASS